MSSATQATGSPWTFFTETVPFSDASPGSWGNVTGPILGADEMISWEFLEVWEGELQNLLVLSLAFYAGNFRE